MFGSKSRVIKRTKDSRGNDKVIRKHGGLFGHKTVTTYKKDWLGRDVSVRRAKRWYD